MAVKSHKLLWLAAILMAVPSVPAPAQSTGQSASVALNLSVTVVRPCSVSTPAVVEPSAPSAAPGAGEVRVSCGRAVSTSSVHRGGIVPVSGATAPASVSSSKTDSGLVVAINF